MGYRYADSAEQELYSELFPIDILEEVKIEVTNFPIDNYRDIGDILSEDRVITVDIRDRHFIKLKSALIDILSSPENSDYAFRDYYGIDEGNEFQMDDLVEIIISEPFSPIVLEVQDMIAEAELRYVERFGNFEYH